MCGCELRRKIGDEKLQIKNFNYSANSAIVIMHYRAMIKCKMYGIGVICREE